MKNFSAVVIFLICTSFLLGSSPVSAKTYAWTDKNGNTRFTDYPPPPGEVMQVQPRRPRQRAYIHQKSYTQQEIQSSEVELYVTSWCPYCKKAIEYFESKGIEYKTYDIEKDKNAARRKKKLDKRGGVPFAVINGKKIHGYIPKLYAEALQNNN